MFASGFTSKSAEDPIIRHVGLGQKLEVRSAVRSYFCEYVIAQTLNRPSPKSQNPKTHKLTRFHSLWDQTRHGLKPKPLYDIAWTLNPKALYDIAYLNPE